MLSNLLMQLGNHTNAQLEENMVRHMILNSLRSYKVKFGDEYGEMVIACDNTNYWRKQVFPYYKANRKKNIENSELDWKALFECLNKIRAELKEYFPYRVNSNVSQYDPTRKKWIKHDDPERYLHEHILKGDAGDGVPNVLSPDNVFVVGDRQRPLTAKKMEKIMGTDLEEMDTSLARNYSRNVQLIDLSFTPETIREKVMEQFEAQKDRDRSKLLNYFIVNKLKNLTEHLSEF